MTKHSQEVAAGRMRTHTQLPASSLPPSLCADTRCISVVPQVRVPGCPQPPFRTPSLPTFLPPRMTQRRYIIPVTPLCWPHHHHHTCPLLLGLRVLGSSRAPLPLLLGFRVSGSKGPLLSYPVGSRVQGLRASRLHPPVCLRLRTSVLNWLSGANPVGQQSMV